MRIFTLVPSVLHCNSMTTTIHKILQTFCGTTIFSIHQHFFQCVTHWFSVQKILTCFNQQKQPEVWKKKCFKKIHNTSPTYLSLKISCAVFSSFFLPTSFRGKSAFTLSRGAWHLSLTTWGISSISKRCCSIGGSGLSGWKALCCKHCKEQNSLSKVELSIILKTFHVMPVHHMVTAKLNVLPLYSWKIFCLTVDWKSMIDCLRRLLMILNKNTDADECSHTHWNFCENY